jgi:hypothetical protein
MAKTSEKMISNKKKRRSKNFENHDTFFVSMTHGSEMQQQGQLLTIWKAANCAKSFTYTGQTKRYYFFLSHSD